MRAICRKVPPYACPDCRQDLLAFISYRSYNEVLDYKSIMDYNNPTAVKEIVNEHDPSCIKCMYCGRYYVINWARDAYPWPMKLEQCNALFKKKK